MAFDDGADSDCVSKFSQFKGFTLGTIVSGVGNMMLALTLSVYILFAIYSFLFALRRFQSDGVSKRVRSMFLKKHLYYIAVFITIWTFQLASKYFKLFNPPALVQAYY